MKRRVRLYGWTITWFFVNREFPWSEIVDLLEETGASASTLRRAEEKMRRHPLNEGFTYSHPLRRESVVVIGPVSSGSEFVNTFTHEVAHLCRDMAQSLGIDPCGGEDIAYLAGDLVATVSDIVCRQSCDCCRKERRNGP